MLADARATPCKRFPWLLFLGLFGFFGLTAHGYLENSDADLAMHSARALYLRGNPGLLREGADTTSAERWVARHIHDSQGQSGMGCVGSAERAYTFGALGYQVALVPFVLLGEITAHFLPGPEAEFAATRPALLNELFWTRFWISFLPALAAAGSVLVILRLARVLGASPRQAWLVAGVATLCTQFWPGARETTADSLGMFWLFAAVLRAVEYERGVRGVGAVLAAGVCGGAAVFVRYPHAAAIVILGVWLTVIACRRRRPHDVLLFVLGGLPFAGALAWLNVRCFGAVTETGYAGADEQWWSYPLYLGVPLILFAPGKGVLWFSVPIVFAVTAAVRSRMRDSVQWLAVPIFAATLLLYGRTHGWAAGQCWGIRYMTPGVVLWIVVGLVRGAPWRSSPRRFWVVSVLGLLVTIGGIVTPYRGHQHLAHIAAEKHYAEELADGAFPIEWLSDRVNVHPRFSPLHTHWIYAWHSWRGELRADDVGRDMELVFGVPGPPVRPADWYPREDLASRHYWPRILSDLVGFPWLAVSIAWFAVTIALLTRGAIDWCRRERSAVPSSDGA